MHRSGIDGTEAAHRVGYSYPQARRYLAGETPIRPDQYERFARAFGISPEDLAAELAGADVFPDLRNVSPGDQPDHWTFRAALRGHIPESDIEELARYWEGRPLVNQQSAVEGIRQLAEQERRRNTASHLDTRAG